MSHFIPHSTPIDGLNVIERERVGDSRGFLERMFCQDSLGPFLQGKTVRQINRTLTRQKGTVRGLHFQNPPHAETKIVTCLKGQVWDVAVDLRRGSPTFLEHHAVLLTEDNHYSFLIPEGFAHGFQTLTSDCEMLYFHTADYNVEFEGALNAIDPSLSIPWPAPITERSDRDVNHPMVADDFQGIELS
jgi:dTDP-4-dehydrorhamnose 3,5-epimerase